MKKLIVVSLLVFAFAAQAPAWPQYGISVSRVCEEALNQVRIRVFNYGFDNPMLPDEFTVIRRTTAPGLDEPWLVTETPIPLPEYGEIVTIMIPEPDLPADAIGYYEGWAHWDDGDEQLMFDEEDSCVDHPYLLRGRLLTEYEVQPCEGIGLMECTIVSIVNVEFLQYVGTGEMLDIYGWPAWITDAQNCGIAISHIEPLGMGATCSDPVGTQARSWSAVKALFD